MAKSSTTWDSLTAPKGKGGSKHLKTRVKEKMGLDGWQNLCVYVKGNGADKLMDELDKLEGKDYVDAIAKLMEFIKPKLQRTTLSGDPENPIMPVNINIQTITTLPISETE